MAKLALLGDVYFIEKIEGSFKDAVKITKEKAEELSKLIKNKTEKEKNLILNGVK